MRIPAISLLILSLAAPAFSSTVPRKSPEFAFQLLDGKQVLLSQHWGKVILVEFLFTTCPHCAHTAQLMTRLQKEYGPRGFQALGVAFNDMAGMLLPDFMRQNGVGFPMGVAARSQVLNYLQHNEDYRFVVPQVVIIDRKGMIRVQSKPDGSDVDFYSEKTLRGHIEALLAEGGARKTGGKAKKK